jgi:hypothetical protein
METERRLLIAAAVVECLAGTTFLLFPAVAVTLLLDAEAGSAGVMIARVAGVALFALGVACAGAATEIARPARTWAVMAITIYNAGAGLLLVAFAVRGMAYGPVVWIAGILHLGLASAFGAVVSGTLREITHRPA